MSALPTKQPQAPQQADTKGDGEDDAVFVADLIEHYVVPEGRREAWRTSSGKSKGCGRAEVLQILREGGRLPAESWSPELLFDLFISHRGRSGDGCGTKDSIALPLAAILKRFGKRCFLDRCLDSIPPGSPLAASIVRGLYGCRAAVVVLSRDFWKSKWCVLELAVLLRRKHDPSDPFEDLLVVKAGGVDRGNCPSFSDPEMRAFHLGQDRGANQADGQVVGQIFTAPSAFVLAQLVPMVLKMLDRDKPAPVPSMVRARAADAVEAADEDDKWTEEMRLALDPVVRAVRERQRQKAVHSPEGRELVHHVAPHGLEREPADVHEYMRKLDDQGAEVQPRPEEVVAGLQLAEDVPRIIVLTGDAGSGKSLLTVRLVRDLVDGGAGLVPIRIDLKLVSHDDLALGIRHVVAKTKAASEEEMDALRLQRVLFLLDGYYEPQGQAAGGAAPDVSGRFGQSL